MRVVSTPPAEYVKRFYYDTVVFGADYLAYLVRKFGAGQLLAGTDGPVRLRAATHSRSAEGCGLDDSRIASASHIRTPSWLARAL